MKPSKRSKTSSTRTTAPSRPTASSPKRTGKPSALKKRGKPISYPTLEETRPTPTKPPKTTHSVHKLDIKPSSKSVLFGHNNGLTDARHYALIVANNSLRIIDASGWGAVTIPLEALTPFIEAIQTLTREE